MRFALEPEEVDAAATMRKILAATDRHDTDSVVRRLDEFGAFDASLLVITHEELGYAGVALEPRSDGETATLAAAAELVGLGQRMLDMTVEHVGSRQQFGVPVGSFQAVKHQLADALKELAFARPAVWRAAWSLAHSTDAARRDVSMAKAMASDAASFVARRALQCHGAIGYTIEYDLHIYLKRTWMLARTHGDASSHRARIYEELTNGT
jgi:alkylation response protein AidB-like acyl-CoA dehydrogenase